MNAVRHPSPDHLQRAPESDVSHVVSVLGRIGPATLADVEADPSLAEWDAERLQAALTAAWTRTLVFVDARDRFVAL